MTMISDASIDVAVRTGRTIDTSGQACQRHLRDIEETSLVVGIGPYHQAVVVMRGPPEDDAQSLASHTTPERAVSTNLKPNSTHDILARADITTADATKILLLIAVVNAIVLAGTSLDHATLSGGEEPEPLHNPTQSNIRNKPLPRPQAAPTPFFLKSR